VPWLEEGEVNNPRLWFYLNQLYPVQLIMTPFESLTCWELGGPKDECIGEDGALKYDVLPVKKEGQIIGVMTKKKSFEVQLLENNWLITNDTPISELVGLFVTTSKPAFLVFAHHEVVGIVTPADLNKLPARIYVYSLIGDVELQLSYLIRNEPGITTEKILGLIGKKRSEDIRSDLAKLRDQNVDVDVIQLLYLSDMLTIIQKTGPLRERLGFSSMNQAKQCMSGINELRSQAMHLVKPLLKVMPSDIHTLHNRFKKIDLILSPIKNRNKLSDVAQIQGVRNDGDGV
jgi:hypothetical protein